MYPWTLEPRSGRQVDPQSRCGEDTALRRVGRACSGRRPAALRVRGVLVSTKGWPGDRSCFLPMTTSIARGCVKGTHTLSEVSNSFPSPALRHA